MVIRDTWTTHVPETNRDIFLVNINKTKPPHISDHSPCLLSYTVDTVDGFEIPCRKRNLHVRPQKERVHFLSVSTVISIDYVCIGIIHGLW